MFSAIKKPNVGYIDFIIIVCRPISTIRGHISKMSGQMGWGMNQCGRPHMRGGVGVGHKQDVYKRKNISVRNAK